MLVEKESTARFLHKDVSQDRQLETRITHISAIIMGLQNFLHQDRSEELVTFNVTEFLVALIDKGASDGGAQ